MSKMVLSKKARKKIENISNFFFIASWLLLFVAIWIGYMRWRIFFTAVLLFISSIILHWVKENSK